MEKWSKLKIGTDLFIAKLDRKGAENEYDFGCTFWLSDFKTLWSESFADKFDLIQRLAEKNPTLNIDDETGEQLISKLSAFETDKIDVEIKPDKVYIQHSLNGGMSCTFLWVLKKCNSQVFFDHITKPLLHQIGQLENNEKELMDIIKKKDDEIQQYKLQGGSKTSREQFTTEKFNDDKYTSRPKMFDCSIDDFEDIISPLSQNIAENILPLTNIAATEESISPQKNISTSSVFRTPGKSRKQTPYQETALSYGVEYEPDDDDDTNQPVPMESDEQTETIASVPDVSPQSPKKSSPKKRIRRNFKL